MDVAKCREVGAMSDDQERVKSLLVDTVTLLCKNSLQFERELCVEGLLGVKVDTSDVFFIHISETFKGARVQRNNNNSQEELLDATCKGEIIDKSAECGKADRTIGDDGALPKISHSQEELNKENKDNEIVGETPVERTHNGAEDMRVDSVNIDQDSTHAIARSVPPMAGQRRVPRKASSPHRNLSAVSADLDLGSSASDVSDSDIELSSSGEAEFSGREEEEEEPRALCVGSVAKCELPEEITIEEGEILSNDKRLGAENGACSSAAPCGPDTKVSPWPIIARQLELPTQPAPHLHEKSTTDHIVSDLSQPGCSTWPTSVHHNPAQQLDLVVPPPHFLLTVPESSSILTPPRYPPRSAGGRSGAVGRRRREWCGKWFHCDLCRYQTKRLWNLQRHMRKHVKGQVRCPLCVPVPDGSNQEPACFSTESELRHHLQIAHKGVVEGLQRDGRLHPHHGLLLDLHTDDHLTMVKEEGGHVHAGGISNTSAPTQRPGPIGTSHSELHLKDSVGPTQAAKTDELLPTSSVYGSDPKSYHMYSDQQGAVNYTK